MVVALKATKMIIGEKNLMKSDMPFTGLANSNEIRKPFKHEKIKWDVIVRLR